MISSPLNSDERASALETPWPATGPPTGGLAAALLAGSLACMAFGVLVVGAETFQGWAKALTLSVHVGPLSGESVAAVGAYVVLWPLLHLWLCNRNVNLRRWLLVSIVLAGLGLVLTFPPIFQSVT
jgi:hypothetical protein